MAEEFKNWLVRHMKARGLNQSELALELGKSGSVVNRWLSGAVRPDEQSRMLIGTYFGIDVREINEMLGVPMMSSSAAPARSIRNQVMEIVVGLPIQVPVYEQTASAGLGQEIMEYVYLEPGRATEGRYIAIKVWGVSMEPDIRDGDVIVVDKELAPATGDTVVASVGDQLFVKSLKERSGKRILVGTDGRQLPDEPVIEGVVIEVHHRLRRR